MGGHRFTAALVTLALVAVTLGAAGSALAHAWTPKEITHAYPNYPDYEHTIYVAWDTYSYSEWRNVPMDRYELHRSTTDGFTPGTYTRVYQTWSYYRNSFENTGLRSCTTYYFVLRQVATDGHYVDSAQRAAETQCPPPNAPPVAAVTTDVPDASTCVAVDQEVRFDGSGSSDPDGYVRSYAWDFGDGTTASGRTVTHAFSTVGAFTVKLTVTDNDGASGSETVDVCVDYVPVAVIDPEAPACIGTGHAAAFTGERSRAHENATLTGFAWAFGDGASANGRDVTHAWSAPGAYTVTLTVTDSEGRRGATTVTQCVEPVRFGVDVSPDAQAQDVAPNGAARYALFVENTGNVRDTIDLALVDVADGWSATLHGADGVTAAPAAVTLEPAENVKLVLRVSPPAGALEGASHANLTAASRGDASAVDAGATLTTINPEQAPVTTPPACDGVEDVPVSGESVVPLAQGALPSGVLPPYLESFVRFLVDVVGIGVDLALGLVPADAPGLLPDEVREAAAPACGVANASAEQVDNVVQGLWADLVPTELLDAAGDAHDQAQAVVDGLLGELPLP